MASKILIDISLGYFNNRFVAHFKVYEVDSSDKYPEGIKARFVLVDAENGWPRLLVDNHEPFGFHMHTKLPEDKSHRVKLDVKDHNEALALFVKEVERIVRDEKNKNT